ncbi:MAG: hypothetical protein JW934_17340, partial [Anaerolineae bacterium]|nr:hypothetical protein [Anaerolineae bacterium]
IYQDWRRRLRALPVLVFLGAGMALNSTAAIIEALLGIETAFLRTPKVYDVANVSSAAERSYHLPLGRLVWGELLLALYAALSIVAAVMRRDWLALPFLLLYLAGFSYVAGLGLWEARSQFKIKRDARRQRLGRSKQIKPMEQL